MDLDNRISLKILFAAAILCLAFMTVPEITRAHKVSVFAWVEGDTVHTVGKFNNGKKVKNGLAK